MTKFFLCALLLTVLAVGQGGAAFPQAVWKSAWHCDLAAGSLWHHCHLLIDTGPSCFKYQWVFCVPCLIVSHLFLHLPPILIKKKNYALFVKPHFGRTTWTTTTKKLMRKWVWCFPKNVGTWHSYNHILVTDLLRIQVWPLESCRGASGCLLCLLP